MCSHSSRRTDVGFWAASALVVLALFFALGGFGAYTWVWAVLYFTFVHTSLIFMGVFGSVKALNGEHFVFPVLGRFFTP